MVTVVYQVQRGAWFQPFAHVGDQIEPGEIVPGALEEEHRYIHPVEMISTTGAGLTRRVQREAQKDQSSDAWK